MPAKSAKEKNKVAQRAYRERQKERQKATEEQVLELTERISALNRENELLDSALHAARTRSEEGPSDMPEEETSPAVVLHLGELPPQIQLSRQELAALPLGALTDIWKAMAQEACALMWALMDYSPHLMEDFMHANLEAPEAARPLPGLGSAWPAVMDIGLTAQQEGLLLVTRRSLLGNMGALVAERNLLCQQLNGIVDVEEHPGGPVSNYVQISDIVKQMQERVDAMHACHSYYVSHALTQILAPVQVARLIVQSYPFAPDILALMGALADRQGGVPGGLPALHVGPPSDLPSSSSSPALPNNWRISLSLPISRIRRRL